MFGAKKKSRKKGKMTVLPKFYELILSHLVPRDERGPSACTVIGVINVQLNPLSLPMCTALHSD